MAFKTTLTTKGGGKLQAVLKKAEEARRKQVKVGFFSTAKYEDQTPVATVAAVQEFGAPKASIPERPLLPPGHRGTGTGLAEGTGEGSRPSDHDRRRRRHRQPDRLLCRASGAGQDH